MAQRGPPSPAQAQPLPYGYPFAQPGPNNYPPVDLKDVGIAMIIGIFVPGFGHVYCNKVLLGLAIFTTFIIVLLAALFFGALSFGITSLFFGPLLITIVVLELLSVKGIAEEYNRVVRMTGRPPE